MEDQCKCFRDATTTIRDKILPEMEAQVLAGTNPRHVAERLKKRFNDKNAGWERFARSEISMAAETAKYLRMERVGNKYI